MDIQANSEASTLSSSSPGNEEESGASATRKEIQVESLFATNEAMVAEPSHLTLEHGSHGEAEQQSTDLDHGSEEPVLESLMEID